MKLKTWKRLKKAGLLRIVFDAQVDVPAMLLAIELQRQGAVFEEAGKRVESLAIQWALAGWTCEEIKKGYQRQYWKLCRKER